MISGHTSTRKKNTVKKVLLLNVIGTALPEVTEGNCRRTKAPTRHKKHGGTMALITVKKRYKLWKEWKQGNTRKSI